MSCSLFISKSKLIVLSLILSLFIGCSSFNIDKNTKLNNEEGILVTKIHTNRNLVDVLIHEKGDRSIAIARLSIEQYVDEFADPLKAIKIKSGDACIFRIDAGLGQVFIDPRCFYVKPRSITYIGDIVIELSRYTAKIAVIDNEDETLKEAKEKYPWIFNEYSYHKVLPDVMLNSVEGYKEVEEMRKLKEESPKE